MKSLRHLDRKQREGILKRNCKQVEEEGTGSNLDRVRKKDSSNGFGLSLKCVNGTSTFILNSIKYMQTMDDNTFLYPNFINLPHSRDKENVFVLFNIVLM